MANTRFKGANASERLTLSTLSDSDMFQTRHLPGTVNDADKGVSKALLQALPVAVCATAAATAAKVGTLASESCPDFTLVSGRAVKVYFSTANTASTPTLNLYGTGAIPIVYPDGSFVKTWGAGTWMILMYVSVTIDGTLTQRWVAMNLPADEVAADNMNSVSSNAVAVSKSYSTTEQKTGGVWIDGKPVYRKTLYTSLPIVTGGNDFDFGVIDIPNLELITNVQVFRLINNGYQIMNSFVVFFNNHIYIGNNFTGAASNCYLTLEYTKTTD